ncbi:hypothetical protein ACFX19_007849 [Malus domestica]
MLACLVIESRRSLVVITLSPWNKPFVLEKNNNHGCEIEILHGMGVENGNIMESVNSDEGTEPLFFISGYDD